MGWGEPITVPRADDLARAVACLEMWHEATADHAFIGPCREAAEATEEFLAEIGGFA